MAKPRRTPAKARATKPLTTKKKAGASGSAAKSKPKAAAARTPKKPAPGTKARPKTGGAPKSSTKAKRAPAKPQPPAPPVVAARTKPAPPPEPVRRSTYADAVAAYDKGMLAFHARRFGEAREILGAIITRYPEEKELHERVQMYLNVCDRHVGPREQAPETVEERINASTLAINNGRPDDAIGILTPIADADESNDSAAYLLGVAYAIKQDFKTAMGHLERAIRLNPDNRDLVRKEVDLEDLRQTDEFETLLSTPSTGGRKRKP